MRTIDPTTIRYVPTTIEAPAVTLETFYGPVTVAQADLVTIALDALKAGAPRSPGLGPLYDALRQEIFPQLHDSAKVLKNSSYRVLEAMGPDLQTIWDGCEDEPVA